MASLTPLSKGLIALAVVGAMASAVWHLGLKEKLGGAAPPAPSQPADAGAAVQPATPAPDSTLNTGPDTTVNAPDQVMPPSLPATPAPDPDRKAPASGLSPAENAERGRQLLESKNFGQARVHLEQAVQGGDGSAACLLGEMNLKGQGGLPVSQEKAASLFQFAQSRNIICFTSGQ
ncbi:hypothetical protein [Polaromonas sp.]|uniref:hypothetical protein n=1 Tax=Polaromonas sp. TaxID=1869339 RepID=UPI001A328B24|nr:hypothetical protein [Burkholderiales bacterium]